MKQVLDIRDTEISVLKKAAYLNAFLSFFWTSIPFCVALASFATYVLTDPNNVLTAEKGWFTLKAVYKRRWQLGGVKNWSKLPMNSTKKLPTWRRGMLKRPFKEITSFLSLNSIRT